MSALTLADFDYDLPPSLVAQRPTASREGARLMVLYRGGALEHVQIPELQRVLPAGCLLVVNDTRVFPARLRLRRASGGAVELLLLERQSRDRCWLAMTRSSKKLKAGERLYDTRAPAEERAEVLQLLSEGRAEVRLSRADLPAVMGQVPLPPYIQRVADAADRERYQTVYAQEEGSVAAPTAGLHLTDSLLEGLRKRDVEVAKVTLHVGPGTFLPVRVDDLTAHRMHEERYSVPESTAHAVAKARAEKRKIVAVGTTTVRTLEATGGEAGSGRTEIFIYPGYRFRLVDGLLTNFHLPRSTLLMLVSALAGRQRILEAYSEAVAQRYRFYSYGDAMLIL